MIINKQTLEIKLQAFETVKEFSGEYPIPLNEEEKGYTPYLKMLVKGISPEDILKEFDLNQADFFKVKTIEEALNTVIAANLNDTPEPYKDVSPQFLLYVKIYAAQHHPNYEEVLEQFQKDQLFQEFLREAIHQMHSTDADRASLPHMEEAYSRLNPPLELQTFDLSIEVPETNRYHHHIEAYSSDHADMIINDLDFDHTNGYYDVVFGV